MRWKKDNLILNSRQKKKQLSLSLCVICISLFLLLWGIEHSGKYLSWEKAVTEALEVRGYGAPEEFLLEKDGVAEVHVGGFFHYTKEQPEKWVVTKVTKSLKEAYLVSVQVIRDSLLWQPVRVSSEFYNMELQAWYNENMEMMLGSCQNPDITEVTLSWGHWVEGDNGWEVYVIGEEICPVDEMGFFYQEVDPSKAMVDIITYDDGGWEERMKLIQTVYLEGRDKDGTILYRDGMDIEGRRFVNNKEIK